MSLGLILLIVLIIFLLGGFSGRFGGYGYGYGHGGVSLIGLVLIVLVVLLLMGPIRDGRLPRLKATWSRAGRRLYLLAGGRLRDIGLVRLGAEQRIRDGAE